MQRPQLIRGSAAAAAAAGILLAGCGGGSGGGGGSSAPLKAQSPSKGPTAQKPPSKAKPVSTTTVGIKDFKYMPPQIDVKAGAKVTFDNKDGTNHTATSETAGAFDTGNIDMGQSRAVTLSKRRTFAYHCQYHPFMHGKIVVR